MLNKYYHTSKRKVGHPQTTVRLFPKTSVEKCQDSRKYVWWHNLTASTGENENNSSDSQKPYFYHSDLLIHTVCKTDESFSCCLAHNLDYTHWGMQGGR